MKNEKTKLYFAIWGFAILAFIINLILINLIFSGLTARNTMLNIMSLIGLLSLIAADGWFCAVFLQRKVCEIVQGFPPKNKGETEDAPPDKQEPK